MKTASVVPESPSAKETSLIDSVGAVVAGGGGGGGGSGTGGLSSLTIDTVPVPFATVAPTGLES